MEPTKLGTISAGYCNSQASLSSQLALSYNRISAETNNVIDTLLNRCGPVKVGVDSRWNWEYSVTDSSTGTITPFMNGLSGTSLYTYAGNDYSQLDSLYLVNNPENANQKRPATIYETITKLKTYVDDTVVQRTSRLLNLINNINNPWDISGIETYSLLMAVDGNLVTSTFKLTLETDEVESENIYCLSQGNTARVTFGVDSDYVKLIGEGIKLVANAPNATISILPAAGIILNPGEGNRLKVTKGEENTPILIVDEDAFHLENCSVTEDISGLAQTITGQAIVTVTGGYQRTASNCPIQLVDTIKTTLNNGVETAVLLPPVALDDIYLPARTSNTFDDGKRITVINKSGDAVTLQITSSDITFGIQIDKGGAIVTSISIDANAIVSFVYSTDSKLWYVISLFT